LIVLVEKPEMAMLGGQMARSTVSHGRLLASDADREQVIDTLKAAFVQGLLTKDELELRVGQTLGSRTYAELAAVTADIPERPITAQSPPKRAQVQARAGNTAVKAGLCTLAMLILAASTSAAMSGPGAALIMALFLMGIGAIVAVITALLAAGIRMLESPHPKRSSRQLRPPRSSPGSGGQASRCPAPSVRPGQLPRVDYGQQHTADTARCDLADLQSSGSRPSRQWRSRGLLAAGQPIAVRLARGDKRSMTATASCPC
jgi:hypothetical protein